MARAVDVPFTNNSADHRRALQLAFEHCATPLTMGTAILFTPSTRVRDSVPPGAPTRLSCAAAGVSSGLAGAVKAAMTKSKLDKIEALTVPGAEALPSIQLFERELGRIFETAEDRRRWSEEGARSIVYVKLALKFHTLKFHCNFTAISLKLQPPSADFKQFRF